jgi:TOMM system kinase/cyclase fusion protein
MQCPRCAAQLRQGVRFCEDCGSPLSLACAACGAEIVAGKRFCGSCGAPTSAASHSPASDRPGEPLAVAAQPGQAIAEQGGLPDLLASPPPTVVAPAAERRQLTVMFCDLVDSTVLASRLDPEELREVVRAYQEACAKVIARFEGHVAQYLGDGLLVYFGYPSAHEDDPQRAVRTALGIVEALDQLNLRLGEERGVRLAVRLGIHTGPVVVGEVGAGQRLEQLALGETPNVAARLQGIAAPNAVVISAATLQLLRGYFACRPLGQPTLKGVSQPLELYQVLSESTARSRLEAAGGAGLTPLVGRDAETALLLERWEQVKEGTGQVVLLSGEAGIGKSRLVQLLTEHVASEPQAWLTPCRCSPYHRNSALHPMIELMERLALRFERDEPAEQKLHKLEGFLVQYGLPLAETAPLFASLLSLPPSPDYAPLAMSPEQQRQRTLHALLSILLRIAPQQPVLFVMEDLHWVDPSTLELLSLLVDQGPTARILALMTFRPDFAPPWIGRSHVTQVTLNRLPRRQAAEMIAPIARGKSLPYEVIEQVVAKTDGVPLFVEELTKTMLESGHLEELEDRFELTGPLPPLAIPTTLHDSLMARLDRLAAVKSLAQLGATLGREFSYELLLAVSPWDEPTVSQGLRQLVEAELLYQRGVPPQATYVFKHALIQDAAYQSLLRSSRQQYHQRIAQVLASDFAETAASQPELLAHHFTEAGLVEQAIPLWHQAGQRAAARSANLEAVSHLTKGLELLAGLPATPARAEQELGLQIALGPAVAASRGYASPEVEQVHSRARELCQQVGQTSQLAPAIAGLWFYYHVRAEFRTALELAEDLRALGEREQDAELLLQAHIALGLDLFHIGEQSRAQAKLDEGYARYDPQQHAALVRRFGQDFGLFCRSYLRPLWLLGYPDQALTRSNEAVALARELNHPFTLAWVLNWAATIRQFRREVDATREQAESLLALATEHGFALWIPFATTLRGWALAEQGHVEEGIAAMRNGMEDWRSTGAEVDRPYFLSLLSEAYARIGEVATAHELLAEALDHAKKFDEAYWEPEHHRLMGELILSAIDAASDSHLADAEACFQRAVEVAQRQEARSLELRAVVSLSRLWLRQGKRDAAHQRLSEIYNWFGEGFETADLREASQLLHLQS